MLKFPVMEKIVALNEDAIFAVGLEEAIVGYVQRCGTPTIPVYDRDKCVDIFVKQGMEHSEANEYFEFNVLSAYMGKSTPCFLTRLEEEDIDMEEMM